MKKRKRRTLQQLIKSDEIAQEAYVVLMLKQRPARTISKSFLEENLKEQQVYTEFLKLCMEFDDTEDLREFRKGLALVVNLLGPVKVSKIAGINRVTLYRMLAAGGNPGLKNLIALLGALDLRLWVVNKEFYQARDKVRRRTGRFLRK